MESENATAKREATNKLCRNCDTQLETPFCAQCGQKRNARLSASTIVKDTFTHIANLDSAFTRTVILLFRDPGKVGREYIQGRRIFYYNPLKYLFLTSTIYILIINGFEIDIYPAAFDKPDEKARKIFNLILSLAGYLIFFQLIALAWLQKVFFRKTGINFAENYAFLSFIFGQIMWFHLFFACFGLFGTRYGFWFLIGLDMIYIIWALGQLYENHRPGTILKSFLLFVAHYFIKGVTGILINIFMAFRG